MNFEFKKIILSNSVPKYNFSCYLTNLTKVIISLDCNNYNTKIAEYSPNKIKTNDIISNFDEYIMNKYFIKLCHNYRLNANNLRQGFYRNWGGYF